MKKFLAFLLAAVMATALLAGCGAQKGGTVATDGSTSMEKVINALGESFMQNYSGTTFTYNPTGSGSGIQAVSEACRRPSSPMTASRSSSARKTPSPT